MELKLNKLNYEDIKIGDVHSFERTIEADDVKRFAELSGDQNPLHAEGGVVHGMLLGGLFSALIGMLCPGEKSLYLSQNLNFRRLLKIGSPVKVEGRVVNKSDAAKIIELAMAIKDSNGAVLVDGAAQVKFRIDD